MTKLELSGKKLRMLRPLAVIFSLISIAPAFSATPLNPSIRVVISVRDQKLMLLENGAKVATYPVSTSKFGLGDFLGRMTTPLGYLMVAQKIGDNAPVGAVFAGLSSLYLHSRHPGREDNRPARQLRLHQDEIERHRRPIQSSSARRDCADCS